MGIVESVANLVGVTATQLLIVAGAVVLLTVAWFIIKRVIKVAARIFTIGCFTIVVIGGGLYLYFAVFAQ